MGIANNTSRSLQIISRNLGWDPNRIVDQGNGPGHPGSVDPDLEASYFSRETPFEGATTRMSPLPSDIADPQAGHPKITADTAPTFNSPTPRENQNQRRSESFGHYKPGAGNQGGSR